MNRRVCAIVPISGRFRRVQRAGSDGERGASGEAQIRHRRRQSPVLPLQLEDPGDEAREDRTRLAVIAKGFWRSSVRVSVCYRVIHILIYHHLFIVSLAIN